MAIGGNSILCNPSFTSSLPFTSPPVHVMSLSSTRIPHHHHHHHRRHLGFSFGCKPPPPLLLQWRSRCFRCSRRKAGRLAVSCGGATIIDQSSFKGEVLDSDKPVLVDFVADWCGPCRLIAPVVDWVSQEYEDQLKVVKIDHDANPQLIKKYKVHGLPTLIIFKDGEEVPQSRREGVITKVKLKQFLDSFLEERAVS